MGGDNHTRWEKQVPSKHTQEWRNDVNPADASLFLSQLPFEELPIHAHDSARDVMTRVTLRGVDLRS